jgi:excisionase family DNA binding protein
MTDPSFSTSTARTADQGRLESRSRIEHRRKQRRPLRIDPESEPSKPSRSTNPDPRHIMNPNWSSDFVPETGPVLVSGDLSYGRPPHRRLWRGCAAHLAGREGRPGRGRRGTRRNFPGRLPSSFAVHSMKRKKDVPTFFTERSLAAYLAVSDRTIRNWIRRGDLPSYKLGAARRIDPADVESFLARNRDEAA